MIDDSTLVLFGARGNLSRVKLVPGLFHLDDSGMLPPKMKILSVGRQLVSPDEWEAEIKDMLDKKFKETTTKKPMIALLKGIFTMRTYQMTMMHLKNLQIN